MAEEKSTHECVIHLEEALFRFSFLVESWRDLVAHDGGRTPSWLFFIEECQSDLDVRFRALAKAVFDERNRRV